MNHAALIKEIKARGGPVQAYRIRLIDAMNATGGGTPAVLEAVQRILAPYVGAAESLVADPDKHRNSSPELVKIAEEVMAKARDDDYVPGQDAQWLFDVAKSLAGSVIAQADPTD